MVSGITENYDRGSNLITSNREGLAGPSFIVFFWTISSLEFRIVEIKGRIGVVRFLRDSGSRRLVFAAAGV